MRKILIVSAFCALAFGLHADQVTLQNGDHFSGKVLSMSTNAIVLQNDALGTVMISRSKVATIGLGSVATNPIPPKPEPIAASLTSKTGPDTSSPLRQLATQTNLIQQVQGEFLNGASPEAGAKFNQMVNDLSTGKMNMADLRKQAKSAADQLRELQKEAGDDDTGTMDMYLSILDNFLNETASSTPAATNRIPVSAKIK